MLAWQLLEIKSLLYLISVTIFYGFVNSVLVNCDNPASEQTLFNIWILLSFVSLIIVQHGFMRTEFYDQLHTLMFWSLYMFLWEFVLILSPTCSCNRKSLHLYLSRTCGFTPFDSILPSERAGCVCVNRHTPSSSHAPAGAFRRSSYK